MMVAGLAVLAFVNLGPLTLVLRQALSPPSESVRWPLELMPGQLSLENLEDLWETHRLGGRLVLSAWVGLASMLCSLVIGVPAGWSLGRWKSLQVAGTGGAFVVRMIPPVAIALPLTTVLIPSGMYNHPWGLGLILAHVMVGTPIALLVSYAAFRDIPPELEEAAHVDGCSPLRAFAVIALPAVRGPIAGASAILFLTSWDEFLYALMIQLTNRTMPPLLYYYAEYGQLGPASAMALVMILPAAAMIGFLQRFIVRNSYAGSVL
jgi:multiple sugar transport system permease protein